jgi:Domain of unknown function (DUF4126)
MIEILLAVLSGSAAAGMRIAIPLLVIALYGGDLWLKLPILSSIHPPVIIGILVSWSILELVGSKDRIGQRILQVVELIGSPIVGAILGVAIATPAGLLDWQVGLLATISGLVALVLQLVQMGWMYRMQRIPLWILFGQDLICVLLTLFSFDAPQQGGLIALLLLWLAIRSAAQWRRWYRAGRLADRSTSSAHD